MEPVATDDVFEADPGGFPLAVRNPGPEKSYEAPDNFPAPGFFYKRPLSGDLRNPFKASNMSDQVCPYCNRPLMKIDHYGQVLVGCIDCNRWGHGRKKGRCGMSPFL